MKAETVKCEVGECEILIESGKLAKQADGAVVISCGETIVLVSAVSATNLREGQDYFPLSVEYKEKASAAGRIPGGYFRREGRPTEKEILTCRMTDRPLRPMFPKDYFFDTQIIALLLSADGENDADILCMNGASAALCISDIPFAQAVASVRVGRVNDEFIANPTHEQRLQSELDLVFSGTRDEVIMIEGGAKELPEDVFKQALDFAQQSIQPILKAQEELAKSCGKEKRTYTPLAAREELLEIAYKVAGEKIEDAIYTKEKVSRSKAIGILRDEVRQAICKKYEDASDFEINQAFDYLQKKAFRKSILEKNKRADGRSIDDIRELSGEVNVLPRTHGSGLFARGETQALSTATIAPLDQAQKFDNYAGGEESKRFLLHYNFPPFSVGETGRMGGLNRREIGHGNLAERSIAPLIPDEVIFPYAIRVSSEIMESNGSTSMASVCSGSMALMNAGVPMPRAVAGISVGLVSERNTNDKIEKYLTMLDIIGSEDFFGDMDFKLCGTTHGFTGCQLDLKLPGISLDILKEAIDKATEARMKILEYMGSVVAESGEISKYAPQISTVKINPEKIGSVIGPGGKNIRSIQEESGAEISIEEDGTVRIYAKDGDSMQIARDRIEGITAEIEVGKIYEGKVVSIKDFGVFMEVLPGQDGLVHISEMADFRVGYLDKLVKEGDVIIAKCIGIDDRGRVKMSRKVAMQEQGLSDPDEVRAAAEDDGNAPKPNRQNRGRDNRRGGGGRRGR